MRLIGGVWKGNIFNGIVWTWVGVIRHGICIRCKEFSAIKETRLLILQCQLDKTAIKMTFPRSKWKLIGVWDQLLRFLSVCILIWFLFVINYKRGSRVCAAPGSCGSLGDLGIQWAGDQVSKREDLGTDAEWQTGMGKCTSVGVDLHCSC